MEGNRASPDMESVASQPHPSIPTASAVRVELLTGMALTARDFVFLRHHNGGIRCALTIHVLWVI